MNEEPRRYADDDERPAVQDALRTLRDEAPSEDSRRALLSALGLAPNPSAEGPALEQRPASANAVRAFLRWFCAGLALMALVALALRWLS